MALAEQSGHGHGVPVDSFAVRLRILRYDMGRLSVEDMAEKCDVKTATWSTWENGTVPRNMGAVVSKISAKTGYDAGWLMWGGPLARPIVCCISDAAPLTSVNMPDAVQYCLFDDPAPPRADLSLVPELDAALVLCPT